ncbi:MAG: glycosyltransferase involved in cell wall biosynthesis [Planctomycetota bacterium]
MIRVCAIVPTYDNPRTVRGVVEGLRSRDLEVIVIDDGSAKECERACQQLQTDGLATVIRLANNSGKGAACKAGFTKARELGFTHALQVDADGQHDQDQVPVFVAAAEQNPTALIIAYPIYDDTAPRARKIARRLTDFWVAIEVGSRSKIRDAMIGFRIYPIDAVERLRSIGDRMEFDIQTAVQLVRAGCDTVNLPIKVRYLDKAEGGISHFRPLHDNLRFAWMHSKLCTVGCMRWTFRKLWPFARRKESLQ